MEFEKKLRIRKLRDIIVKYRRQWAWHLSRMGAIPNTKLLHLYLGTSGEMYDNQG
jgi:hypothetical protein